jgi:sec-independent protein translocase protein TatA
MFSLGWVEIGLVLLAALLLFGPKKIPELGSSLGKTLRGFREELGQSKDSDSEDES